MAFASDSTTAPARPLLPFTFQPTPPVDDPRSADELLDEIRRTIEVQLLAPCHATALASESDPSEPLAAAESIAAQHCGFSDLTGNKALASTATRGLLPPANLARALHMRRELHQALDYGFALLDALDLPPLALDVIDDAIATLDALDASDEDREEGGDSEASLGWTAAGACSGCNFDDREHDTADAELTLGWNEKVPQTHLGYGHDDADATALERHGHGFIRSGHDDAETDEEPEDDDGVGDEDSGIGDEDGMQEQLVGWFRCPALIGSNGGYVG